MGRKVGLWAGVLLLMAALLAVNLAAGLLLRGARIDATEDRAYTLTQGSRNIARSPVEPITLTLYYSSKLAKGQATLENYARRVRELLEEFQRASGGKLEVRVVDPEPFSDAEERAVEGGVQGVPFGGAGEMFYFGLVGTNSVDMRETVAFLDPQRERFLEYDIARIISTLANPSKPVVGWMSPLQLEGGYRIDPRTRQPQPTRIYQVMADIKALYELKRVDMQVSEIPGEVSVLIVAHPRNLSDGAKYAIDQFVMRGGRLLLFVDPLCELDEVDSPMPTAQGRSSELNTLLHAWGVDVPPRTLAADQDLALRVMTQQRGEQVPYVLWLEAKGECLNKDDVLTGQVERVMFASAGVIREREGENTDTPRATITPIITTTARASTMDVDSLQFPPDPKKMFSEFVPGTMRLTLAARLSGKVRSAFPDGPPKNPAGEPVAPADAHLKESVEPIRVVVCADADMLHDSMWLRRGQLLPGLESIQKMADNGDVVLGAVDNMSGSSDLIALRARRASQRPFTKVEEMRRLAEQQYKKEETRLDEKVRQTRQRIDELQRQRGDDASGGLVLTPEQRAEIEKLQQEWATSRRELREVRHNLNKDTERLGSMLLWINAGAVPLALIVAALIIAGVRAHKRRRAVGG